MIANEHKRIIGFQAPAWLIEEIDEAAKTNERTRSQELRHRLIISLAQPTEHTANQEIQP
jgi:hypothetical protein